MNTPESLNDAYIEAVKELGGSKQVGVLLWPTKGVEAAQRHLLACLNPLRQEKLSPDEAFHLERLARNRGCHVVMNYRCRELSYTEPQPIEPEDEVARLQREFVEATKMLGRIAQRIDDFNVSRPAERRG